MASAVQDHTLQLPSPPPERRRRTAVAIVVAGLIEGFVESIGGAGVDRFRTLADRDPCQVELSIR